MTDKPKYIVPAPGERGMTALHYAAYCQDLARVRECVEAGHDINQVDDAGWTALVWGIDMAATGEVGAAAAIADYLIGRGSSLETGDDFYPDLVAFAESRDPAVAEHLRRKLGGADPREHS